MNLQSFPATVSNISKFFCEALQTSYEYYSHHILLVTCFWANQKGMFVSSYLVQFEYIKNALITNSFINRNIFEFLFVNPYEQTICLMFIKSFKQHFYMKRSRGQIWSLCNNLFWTDADNRLTQRHIYACHFWIHKTSKLVNPSKSLVQKFHSKFHSMHEQDRIINTHLTMTNQLRL